MQTIFYFTVTWASLISCTKPSMFNDFINKQEAETAHSPVMMTDENHTLIWVLCGVGYCSYFRESFIYCHNWTIINPVKYALLYFW